MWCYCSCPWSSASDDEGFNPARAPERRCSHLVSANSDGLVLLTGLVRTGTSLPGLVPYECRLNGPLGDAGRAQQIEHSEGTENWYYFSDAVGPWLKLPCAESRRPEASLDRESITMCRTRSLQSLRPVATRQQLSPSVEIQLKNRYSILVFGWKDKYVPVEETTRPTGLNSQEEKTLSISLLSVGNWHIWWLDTRSWEAGCFQQTSCISRLLRSSRAQEFSALPYDTSDTAKCGLEN